MPRIYKIYVSGSNSEEKWEDRRASFQEDLEPGDYAVVGLAIKHRVVHYVGIIRTAKDEDGEYEIQLFHGSTKHMMDCACLCETHKEGYIL